MPNKSYIAEFHEADTMFKEVKNSIRRRVKDIKAAQDVKNASVEKKTDVCGSEKKKKDAVPEPPKEEMKKDACGSTPPKEEVKKDACGSTPPKEGEKKDALPASMSEEEKKKKEEEKKKADVMPQNSVCYIPGQTTPAEEEKKAEMERKARANKDSTETKETKDAKEPLVTDTMIRYFALLNDSLRDLKFYLKAKESQDILVQMESLRDRLADSIKTKN